MTLKEWLAETHGTEFELVRHFVRRFFDSDLVTETGQWTTVFVSAFALMAPAFFLLAQALERKYRYFSRLATSEPYQRAVRADELWLITLTMCVVGLLTAVQWQSLFPGKRDYFALGTLPVRPRQIFLAKLLALLLLISAVIGTLIALPSLLFPLVSGGRWQVNPSLWVHIGAHTVSSALACYFCFFSLLALQGLLLNLLRPLWFVQGLAVTVMLIGIVMSFRISPSTNLPDWLPPMWFVGLYQVMLGDPDPRFSQLSGMALQGLGVAISIALITYLISYRRHQELTVEGSPHTTGRNSLGSFLLGCLVREPRQQAVVVFVSKTMARSSQHRVVLMGYFGFSLALVVTGLAGLHSVVKPNQMALASFAYGHMILLFFMLAGLRQAFEIPSELRANWTFQVMEREGRDEWLRAVDSIAIMPVLLTIIILPAPFEIALLGWQGLREIVVFAAAYLLFHESIFRGWQKLPFTCSYLPGQKSVFFVVLRFFAILGFLPFVNLMFVAIVANPIAWLVVTPAILAVWFAIRRSRRDTWSYTPLRYIEEPEPAVRSLRLGNA